MSHLSALIEERLGDNVVAFIAQEKSLGKTYREIAQSLTTATGITVSKSSVHLWAKQNPEEGK
jgi:PP-loop superfamily ATP-utilizing enzyme